jgi:hypothetical protein
VIKKLLLAPVLIWVWLFDTYKIESFCGPVIVLGALSYATIGATIFQLGRTVL